jgi:hypothetical protein
LGKKRKAWEIRGKRKKMNNVDITLGRFGFID